MGRPKKIDAKDLEIQNLENQVKDFNLKFKKYENYVIQSELQINELEVEVEESQINLFKACDLNRKYKLLVDKNVRVGKVTMVSDNIAQVDKPEIKPTLINIDGSFDKDHRIKELELMILQKDAKIIDQEKNLDNLNYTLKEYVPLILDEKIKDLDIIMFYEQSDELSIRIKNSFIRDKSPILTIDANSDEGKIRLKAYGLYEVDKFPMFMSDNKNYAFSGYYGRAHMILTLTKGSMQDHDHITCEEIQNIRDQLKADSDQLKADSEKLKVSINQ